MTSTSLFARQGDTYLPAPEARSLWSEGMLHGGPVAALLARAALDHIPGPGWHVARFIVDLFRPVPTSALRPEAYVVRDGRRIRMVDVRLLAGDEEIVRASALMLRQPDGADGDVPVRSLPPPETIAPAELMPANLPIAFHSAVEWRHVVPPGAEGFPVSWIRAPLPLIDGEDVVPFVRAAMTADFVNALSNMGGRARQQSGFINTDITLYLHRYPQGEWIGVELIGRDAGAGIAVASAVMHDTAGRFGSCLMATLANPRPSLVDQIRAGA